METIKEKCIRLEHFETPEWAARAILKKEKMVGYVLDPCAGTGVLHQAAVNFGYEEVWAMDIYDWGYQYDIVSDFFDIKVKPFSKFTVLMNPPFSLATQFVEKSIEIGAEKIVCFQRFAWWESKKRKAFWEKYPPSRVYICGDRANCWRHDIPKEGRSSSTPTAHAWFVWDFTKDNNGETMLGHIYK